MEPKKLTDEELAYIVLKMRSGAGYTPTHTLRRFCNDLLAHIEALTQELVQVRADGR